MFRELLRRRRRTAQWRGYVAAAISVGVATALTWLLGPVTDPLSSALFFPGILFVSWNFGFRAGALAIFLSAVALGNVVLPPVDPVPFGPIRAFQLVLFTSIGIVLVLVAATNSRLLAHLQELTNDLERRVAERTSILERQTATLRSQATLLDLAHDAIFVRTLDEGVITFWNHGAEQLYGWSKSEAHGRVSHELLQTQCPVPVADMVAQVLDRGRWRGELRQLRKDGQWIVVESDWALQRDSAGEPVALLESNRDLTERKRAEAEHAQLEQAQAAQALAEETARVRTEFLSVAAHELKTPITGLRLAAQQLSRLVAKGAPFDADRIQRMGAVLDQTSERETRLVNQLLDISRIELGRLAMEPRITDLVALAQGVLETMQLLHEKQRYHLEGPRRLIVHVDPLRIEQVLLNLVENAAKFGPREGVVTIELSQAESKAARMCVVDQGIGIPAEFQEKIFDRFFQMEAGERRTGMGLGLYLSRQIVERHGGRLWVESPAGGGARFVVELPV